MPDKRITDSQRRQVRERANGCCEYCRSQEMFATESFSVDHIVPRKKGGETKLHNLAYACLGCNGHKSSHTHVVDPATGDLAALFHPRQQKWPEHFTWSEDLTEILGITPTGRATVATLQLNRQNLVNLRHLILLIGKHPPQ